MIIKVSEKEISLQSSTSLEEIAKLTKNTQAICAKVDGRLRELTYVVDKNSTIEFLDLTNRDAVRIYEASLRYLFALATYRCYPESKIKFNYSISRSILAVIDDKMINKTQLDKIIKEVNNLIEKDYLIKRISISKKEAKEVYEKQNMDDKVETLAYRKEKNVNLYECANYMNYVFSYMVPSTRYLKQFKVFSYYPGFIIQYPRAEANGLIPTFVDAPTFGLALKDVARWGRIINGNTIAKINEYTKSRDSMVDFVNLCETKHNNQLSKLGQNIYDDKDDIRLICVAGPSSSGKTTFTNKLRIELLSKGIKPVMISMDDYYLEKEQAPKDEFGKPDLEHVNALDVDLFNQDMLSLIEGEEVTLPHFDFKLGKRVPGKKIKVDKNSPILIEGIHALNDKLTSSIPNHQKYKIYIAPQTQLHIDNHNPISITDLRLLRRSVRDQKYRNTPVTKTFDMWQSVRSGEFKWIYPFQESANFVFNSELTYEFAILKKYALPHLLEIKPDNPHFITANRLVKFLKYFQDIDEDLIPNNSLLKEFIGGSPFHD